MPAGPTRPGQQPATGENGTGDSRQPTPRHHFLAGRPSGLSACQPEPIRNILKSRVPYLAFQNFFTKKLIEVLEGWGFTPVNKHWELNKQSVTRNDLVPGAGKFLQAGWV